MKLKDFLPPVLIKGLQYARVTYSNAIMHKRYDVNGDDYNAKQYWRHRHKEHGFHSLKGVGHGGLSEEENRAWYDSARYIFSGILQEVVVNPTSKVLELGYGTGFYTGIINCLGIQNYLGIDIVDEHIKDLQSKYPNFRFKQADIGIDKVDYPACQLIYMIDVSQHITNDDKLLFCLKKNVYDNLDMGGVFIITDELKNKKYSFYEKSRSIEYYINALNLPLLHKPILFRDKYIFSFKKK